MAALLAATMAYDVWRVPVQVYDSLIEILDAQRSPSVAASFRGSLDGAAYLRPARIAQIKAIYDVSGDHLRAGYRGFHVALLLAFFWLFARALRVESGRDASAAVFALTVVTGLHTFPSFMREAFPINHFLEIAVLGLVAVNLAQSRGGWWADAAAALVFALAALTLESGLLVWVVVAAAWASGFRGISTRGVVLLTALVAGYFLLRLEVLSARRAVARRAQLGVPLRPARAGRTAAPLRRRAAGLLRLQRRHVAARRAALGAARRRVCGGALVARRRCAAAHLGGADLVGADHRAHRLGGVAARPAGRPARRGRQADDRRRRGAPRPMPCSPSPTPRTRSWRSPASSTRLRPTRPRASPSIRAGSLRRPGARAAASLVLLTMASLWAIRSVSVHHVMNRQAFRVRNDWVGAPAFPPLRKALAGHAGRRGTRRVAARTGARCAGAQSAARA
jgi:hypothetical protein